VYRRRIKVIDNVFQYRSIAILLVVVVCGAAAFTAGLLLVTALAGAQGIAQSGHGLLSFLPSLLINDLVIMVLLIIAGIFLTHRVAGPVFRIQSDIDKVLAGEKNVRVRFRRRDAFPELAEKVNKLIERIDDKPQR
jgi:methyl-accepting chemotaxis protein